MLLLSVVEGNINGRIITKRNNILYIILLVII